MMQSVLDPYNFLARACPVYITLSPITLLLSALAPSGLQIPIGGAAAIVFIPISLLISQVGADFGKRIEKGLWRKWGGPPTTRFLQHGNREFNKVTRDRVHQKLQSHGLSVPTPEEQTSDERAAAKTYESCVEEIIRNTRSKKDYPLVFKGLTEYGFRRNLLGMRRFGLGITITVLTGTVWTTISRWSATDLPAVPIVTGLITAGLLLTWIFWVTERTVKLAANRYARFILEAALDRSAPR